MDVVYAVRPGDKNEELRHSLRSLAACLPHGRVWMVGHKPAWVSDEVWHIPVAHDPKANKYVNARAVAVAAVTADGPSDDALLMHDDMFFTAPMESMPLLHRGTGAEFEKFLRRRHSPSSYSAGAAHTHAWLRRLGLADEEVVSYSHHCPLPVHRPDAAAVFADLPPTKFPWHLRTIYGSLCRIGGEYVERDCKVNSISPSRALLPFPYPLVSTSDRTFSAGGIGKYLRQAYALPCRYEARP